VVAGCDKLVSNEDKLEVDSAQLDRRNKEVATTTFPITEKARCEKNPVLPSYSPFGLCVFQLFCNYEILNLHLH
jgi:hypothetical protein